MAHNKGEDLEKELDSIKRDIDRLQGDIKEAMNSAGNYSKEKLEDARTRFQSAVKNLETHTQECIHTACDKAKTTGKEAIETGRTQIGQHPMTSVITAFVAGAVISRMMRHSRKS